MGEYTRAISGQRLGKYFLVARQQIVNNVTVGLQWKRGVSTWSVPRCYKQGTKSVDISVREYAERRPEPEAEE
jgi:hypothetical protein